MNDMKFIIFVLLNFSTCFCQNLTKDQKEILSQEILRTRIDYPLAKEVLTDSLLINKEIYQEVPKIDIYKSEAVKYNYLTKNELKRVFGLGEDLYDINGDLPLNWNNKDFQGIKVALYFPGKFNKVINGQSVGIFLGNLDVITLGIPVIKKDGKYGIIQWYNERYGNSISIYKRVNGEWKFYKTFSSMNF
jgi:hypothetical protein